MAINQLRNALYCCICPKKPKFSDVSHLLTHVASKGHLLHIHNTKHLAKTDSNSQALLDQYERWSSCYNIEGLVSQRLRLKEKKRKPHDAARHRLKTNNALISPDSSRARAKAQPRQALPSPSFGNLALCKPAYESPVKPEHTIEPLLAQSGLFPAHDFHKGAKHSPQLFTWPTHRPGAFNVKPLRYPSPPCAPAHHTFFNPYTCSSPVKKMEHEPIPCTHDAQDNPVSEAARLKGIFWPGMDIFDSATAEMRRKRNQKKDASIVDTLEQLSQEVSPIEHVYEKCLGSLKRSLPITGLPELESSPEPATREPLEVLMAAPLKPKPKLRTPARNAQPLADRDRNNGRRQYAGVRSRPVENQRGRENEGPHKRAKLSRPRKATFPVYIEDAPGNHSRPTFDYSRNNFQPDVLFDATISLPSIYRSAHDGNLLTFSSNGFHNMPHAPFSPGDDVSHPGYENFGIDALAAYNSVGHPAPNSGTNHNEMSDDETIDYDPDSDYEDHVIFV